MMEGYARTMCDLCRNRACAEENHQGATQWRVAYYASLRGKRDEASKRRFEAAQYKLERCYKKLTAGKTNVER